MAHNLEENPETVDSQNPSWDQVVKIYLKNGQIITFTADWNFGLGKFVQDYEAFYWQGTKQPSSRYQMQDKAKKTNAHLNLKFEDILALHLQRV